jgi:hypothetical protein
MNHQRRFAFRVISGPDKGAVFALNKSKFLGSQDDCEVRLHDPTVEAVHARVKLRGDGCMIVSLAEEVGLTVNGAVVRAAVLVAGDRVAVGNTVMEIVDVATLPNVPKRPEAEPVRDVSARQDVLRVADSPDHREHKVQKTAPASMTSMGTYLLYAVLGLLVVLVTVITVDELSDRRKQKEIIKNAYDDALAHSMAHPGDYDKIVEKYKIVLALSIGSDANLENYVKQEISRIEADKARREAQLAASLDIMDKKVAEFVARHEYENGTRTYEACDPAIRDAVLAARTTRISEIKREAEAYSQRIAADRARTEAERKAAKEKQTKQELNAALREVADLMIKGDAVLASSRLAALVADGRYEYYKPAFETAQTTIDLLASTDKMKKMSADGKETSAGGTVGEGNEYDLSPIVAAVFAVRKGDMAAAAEALERDDGHILRSAFLDMVQAAGGKVGTVKCKGATALADMWCKQTGEKVNSTPGAEEMVILLEKKALETDDDAIEKLCVAIADFAAKCEDRSVTNKYSSFFDTAGKLLIQVRDGK